MRPHVVVLRFALILTLGFSTAAGQVQLTNAFPFLTFTRPVFLTHPPRDGTNRIVVVQQNGLIRVFPNDTAAASTTTFLNITDKLSATSGEEGLLGLAFHPEYATNGYFYVNYTAPDPLRTVIARYSVRSDDPDRADSLSEFVVLTIDQPFANHNGGMIFFGSDGYLYIGMGDGGGDSQDNGQNLQTLLGKILRIDVDTTRAGYNYGIPPGNPFEGDPASGKEEIYSWGFRNPWRFTEDRQSGLVLVGDVGAQAWEEIDVLEVGLNYGWRCYEGNAPFDLSGCGPISDYTFPIKVYPHSNGDCSITGGYIYRGYRRPELTGAYIYADYCTGRIRLLRYENGQVIADSSLIDAPFSISSFGLDRDGELYICNLEGTIHRFVDSSFEGISCSEISQFQSRCRPGGIIQARVILTNNLHTRDSVQISIDQVPYYAAVSQNGRALLSIAGFAQGRHTVELTDPVGCFPPTDVACRGGLEKGDEEEWGDDSGGPLSTKLFENYPDPFNPETTIRYSLGENSLVTINVFSVLGQRVRTLVNGYQDAGEREVVWDGKTDDGQDVASGMYIYRMTAANSASMKRMLLIR